MFDFLHFVSLCTFLYQSYTIHVILTHPAIFGMVLDHISYTKLTLLSATGQVAFNHARTLVGNV